MARFFISYSRERRRQTSELASAIEALGHDVWWDTELVSGDAFRETIDRELNVADIVIVVWTRESVSSRWVIAEADHAERLDKLLPLRTRDVEPWQIPKPYGRLHTDYIDDFNAIKRAINRRLDPARASSTGETASHAQSTTALWRAHDAITPVEQQATVLQIFTALILVISGVLAAVWLRQDSPDKSLLAMGGGAVGTVALTVASFIAAGASRRPIALTNGSYVLAMLALFLWVPLQVALAFVDQVADGRLLAGYPYMLSICGLASLTCLLLLIAQLRGSPWLFTALQVISGVLALLLTTAAVRQFQLAEADPTWFTSHHEAMLHQITVAAGFAGAAVSTIYLGVSLYRRIRISR